MNDCIFCKIIKDEIPASIVYKDDICLAFMDIKPINPGHVLVIPKKHAQYVEDLDEETAGHLFRTAQKLSKTLRVLNIIKCEDVGLWIANGPTAGQEIPHVHLHVIPRYAGDGFGFKFGPNYENPPERSVLDKIAHNIKEELEKS